MFDYLYEWLRNVSFYMILVTAAVYVLPSGTYRKYIHFFTGLVLILLLLNPIISFFGRNEYQGEEMIQKFEREYEEKISDIIANMVDVDEEIIQDETGEIETEKIELEEIVIGP